MSAPEENEPQMDADERGFVKFESKFRYCDIFQLLFNYSKGFFNFTFSPEYSKSKLGFPNIVLKGS